MKVKEKKISSAVSKDDIFFVGDIGGTKTRFGFFQKKEKKLQALIFFYGETADIISFAATAHIILERFKKMYNYLPSKACFAIAGVVDEEKQFGKLTNQPLELNATTIEHSIKMPITIINDFEALAWGLDLLSPKDLVTINKPSKKNFYLTNQTKICIGAGTGLGKSVLIWDKSTKHYSICPSEGGHADFPLHNQLKFKLKIFINKRKKLNADYPLEWEDLLSGRGLQNIYRFLGTIKKYKETAASKHIKKNNYDPYLITFHQNQKIDAQCRDTLSLFIAFYGRCAKNFALESLALGGIYIAGGIAAESYSHFRDNPLFKKEFLQNKKYTLLLGQIPITIITNNNAHLIGSGAYCLRIKK